MPSSLSCGVIWSWPEHGPEAVALWVLQAHALDAFQCSPILALLSPEKRCGKTTALSVIAKIVPKGVFASNTSPAAVYRIIEKWRPTLLVDEMDTFIEDNNELRGVLNSGHYRSASFVMRVSGDELEPKLFSTWPAKVVAMIGKLPGTLADRAIEVPLKRKRPDERVTRFRNVRPGDLPDLNRKAIRWAVDNLISLRDASLDVSVPESLHDRAADNWESLLTIADRFGGEWPERARKAALALSGNGAAEDGSIGVTLLGDIKAIFERRALTVPDDWRRISSRELADALATMEGRPWPDWKGTSITANAVARLLRPFKIAPKQLRCGPQNVSGYELSAFTDAFERYLSPAPPSTTPTSPTHLERHLNFENQTPTAETDVGVSKGEKASGNSVVAGVVVEKPPAGRNESKRRRWRWRRQGQLALGNNPMSCRSITQIIRQARNAGILIELEENGNASAARAERAASGNGSAPPRAQAGACRVPQGEGRGGRSRAPYGREPTKADLPEGRATILYLHGNGGHIGYRGDRVRPFIDAGFGVLLVEYRGYGGNPGRPSEQGLMSDARAALVFLNTAGALPAATVLYGESLGNTLAGAIAAEQAAAGQPVAALVLEAPFSSVSDVAAHHYP